MMTMTMTKVEAWLTCRSPGWSREECGGGRAGSRWSEKEREELPVPYPELLLERGGDRLRSYLVEGQ